ncbi:myeloid differentiation primary response protein MyD88-like [Amphiura filiformis]|uniref:myeloid differentiation primary response protein MyD88-like n=1 Tax=Amphiura filiformis TaxID=82378 RepID=UPI003B2205EB
MSGFLARIQSEISRKQRKSKEPIASVHKFNSDSKTTSSSAPDEASSDSEEFMFVSSDQCTDPAIDQTQFPSSESNLQNPQPHEPMASTSAESTQPRLEMASTQGAVAPQAVNAAEDLPIIWSLLSWKLQHCFAPDPTETVLQEWETRANSTIGVLFEGLDYLGREDVLEELEKPIKIDVDRWKKKNSRSEAKPLQVAEVSGSYPNTPRCQDLRGITLSDHPDGPVETFDAYICHNTATDYPFVLDIIQKMENPPYNLRLCTDWRDLVPGGDYNTVTAELIENRCKRMIVVLSPEFLESDSCDFHIKFALSLSPGARSRRMVLVMLKPCEPPNILRFITVCDYTREALRPFFWPRLYAALNLS